MVFQNENLIIPVTLGILWRKLKSAKCIIDLVSVAIVCPFISLRFQVARIMTTEYFKNPRVLRPVIQRGDIILDVQLHDS